MTQKFLVIFFDIHGRDLSIEKEVLEDIATLERINAAKDTKNMLFEKLRYADAIAVKHEKIGSSMIERLEKCRIIARFGSGYDNIDTVAATSKGIVVSYVPDYCSEVVAEHILACALWQIRGMKEFEKRIEQRYWCAQDVITDTSRDVTLGIIGLGRIGSSLSLKARGVGFKVIAYDPFKPDNHFRKKRAKRAIRLSHLLKKADILSLNVPLTQGGEYPTYRMIGKKEFQLMRKNAFLINTSRGEVLVKEAFLTALKTGTIKGAALDVLENEPRQDSNVKKGINSVFDAFKTLPNVFLTPHAAFSSTRSRRDVKFKGAMEIRKVLEGKFPRLIAWVNPEVKKSHLKKFPRSPTLSESD
jgi:D-3-phosphoglycerate dehydrogenase